MDWRANNPSCDSPDPRSDDATTVPDPTPPLDPFAFWRDMLSQWEKGANAFANRATESDAFAQGMNRLMGTSLSAKKLSDEWAARMLVLLNLPSRADVEALGERLQSIEDRLIEVTRALESVTGVPVAPPAPGPRRTRRPPPDEPAATPSTPPAAATAEPAKKRPAAKKATAKKGTRR